MWVGRDRELAELVAALARARDARGSLFLLAGEPGIGKTRLASEAAEAARALHVKVAWGRCWEAGGAPAFWPWREACEALAVPFPDAGAIATPDPAAARFELFRATASAVARAASQTPLLLVLEDLHAADRSSLLLLDFIAGQLRAMPAVVIGTYRDIEARQREDATDAIARVARAGRVLQLARLGAGDVGSLVRNWIEGADERLVATIFDTTQGNPLFVDEIVRDIRAHGRRSGLPLGVREVIRQRLQPLSQEARAVLEACSVLGVELAAADVVRMIPTAAGELEAAIERGLLVPRDDRLRFSHALYREALYYDLPLSRRHALHHSAARALAGSGAPVAELAHHLLESGEGAIAEAVDHAIRAAVHAAGMFAYEDALAMLARAHAAIPSENDGLRGRVLVALGETKLRSGDPSGRAACVEGADLARRLGDAELLARAGLAQGAVFLMGGVDPALVATLEEALAGLPAADAPLRARVMARLAAARQPSPPADRQRDIDLGLAAIAMARRIAGPRELLDVLHAAAGILYGAVDPRVRLPIAREAEALAEELGDMPRLLHARVRLANDHLELGDYAAYARLADTYEELAARLGPEAAPWRVPLMRSMVAISRDDFRASERLQAEARTLGAGQPRARRAEAFHRFGFLRAAERHAELRAAISELRGLWLAMPYGQILAGAREASVLARIGADEELRDVLGRMPDAAVDEEINATSLADAMWATADPDLARRLEPILANYAGRWAFYWFDCEIVDAPNDRARAYAAAILGRYDEAERRFAKALADVETVGRRALVARMRFELGDLLLRLGRDGRELVARGRREADALGLRELVALVDRRHDAPRVARSRRPAHPPARFRLELEGEYYALPGSTGTLRFKASRGMQYLCALVDRPNTDIHVLELMGSPEADRGDPGELLDAAALRAYRSRLDTLRDAVEVAEELGDRERAERCRAEMEAIAGELGRATRKGGRARHGDSAVDRARSAVQRRIKDALNRIAEQDPTLGGWLRRAIHTGNHCSFRPET